MNVTAVLANCPLFAGLPRSDLRRVAELAVPRRYGPATTLFEQGDPCDRFYVVGSGRVKVYQLGEQGREQILHVVHPGESFAEAALFAGQAFPASAQTLEECVLLSIPAAGFRDLLRRDPDLCLRLMASLARWLRRLVDLVEDLSLRDVQTRLAGFLLREAEARSLDLCSGARIPLGTTKSVLARRLGTVSETLSRALYKLQQQGAIRVSARSVFVVDPERLRALGAAASRRPQKSL